MSDVTIFYDSPTLCPNEVCGHPWGWHGADTAGCSSIGAGDWCSCAAIDPNHPHIPDEIDDALECRVCRRPLDVVLVHADEPPIREDCGCSGPPGWHCPGEESEHWTSGDDPDGECGHCGSRPSEG